MGAVRLVFHAELRRRWRSWLAIALLISVVGGLVLAAAAAGRRTENGIPALRGDARLRQPIVYATRPVPAVAHLPGVTSADGADRPRHGQPDVHLHPPDQRRRTSASPSSPPRDGRSSSSSPATCPTRRPPTRCWRRSPCNRTTACTWARVIHVPFYAPSQAVGVQQRQYGAHPEPARSDRRIPRGRVRSQPSSSSRPERLLRTTLYTDPGVRAHGAAADGGATTCTSSACATVPPASPSSTQQAKH